MSQGQTAPPQPLQIDLSQPPRSKFERERRAFFRLLPQLLASYRGQYVAVHDEQVVDHGPERLPVAWRVLQRVGNVDIYVGLVSDQPEAVSRSGVRRDLSGRGPA
jgi:Family of unknown function (DUF5678)